MSNEQHKFTIGRDRACDIPLADDTVSSHHAEISFIGGGKVLLTDTNSCNGTYIVSGSGKGQRIRQELISPLDRVRFGSVPFAVKDLLEALRMKFPRFEETLNRPAPKDEKPWISGRRLIRCECGGIIRPQDKTCPECGR